MKAWLKGGLVGIGLCALYVVIGLIFMKPLRETEMLSKIYGFPLLPVTWLVQKFIGSCIDAGCLVLIPITWIFVIIFVFVIGALIGLLIEKLRNH